MSFKEKGIYIYIYYEYRVNKIDREDDVEMTATIS